MKVGDLVELSARGMDLKEFRHIDWAIGAERARKYGKRRMIGIITEVKQCVVSYVWSTGYMVKWFDGTPMYRFTYVRHHLKMAR